MIFRILIFVSGLDAVMAMAQGLPVTLVPEELAITSMRDDVIDVGCPDVLAFLQALYAEGMRLKVTLACSLPCPAIASAAGTPHLFWVQRLVCLAVLCTVGHKRWAARMTAGCVWSKWHLLILSFTKNYHFRFSLLWLWISPVLDFGLSPVLTLDYFHY